MTKILDRPILAHIVTAVLIISFISYKMVLNLGLSGKCKITSDINIIQYSFLAYWSVGPRRPSDQSDAFVAGFLYMFLSIYLSIFLCLVVGFRPRFHGYHLAPSEDSCSKRQTTYQALTGSTDLGNV